MSRCFRSLVGSRKSTVAPGVAVLHPTRRLLANAAPKSTPEVRILEVGPRDGLQNIKISVPTATKIDFIKRLTTTGLLNIEATSFVSPKWVPQLADGAHVMEQVLPMALEKQINFPVLAPNLKGLQNALKSKAQVIVVFASATEAFSKKNQNCTVDEALAEAERVTTAALAHGVAVRGVVSCIFSDPYSGPSSHSQVLHVVKRFLEMGCYEVGLGDTLGFGTPRDTKGLLDFLLSNNVPADRLAGHFHDTYGQGVANVVAAYSMGIRAFDSSVAGLGGCPYAKGAKGNVATEDVVYTLEQSGVSTGVDLDKLICVGGWISEQLGLPNGSRAGAALLAKKATVVTATTYRRSTTPAPRVWKIVERSLEYTVSRAENVVKITLTRPQKGNMMTLPMLKGLTSLFNTLAKDTSVFHIILDAEGKFFCTGMDLSTGTDRTGSSNDDDDYYSKVAGLFSAIENVPQTTIAKIHGPCYAGGVGLGFVFDIRLVSTQARWTLSEIKLGLSPAIISRYLVREWGFSFLREAMLTGREVHAEELYRIGAVHGLAADAEKLDDLLNETLERLAQAAPQSAALCKQLIRLAWTDAGGREQDGLIEEIFHKMMVPGSEGEFGIQQFQKRIRNIQWGDFWASKTKS